MFRLLIMTVALCVPAISTSYASSVALVTTHAPVWAQPHMAEDCGKKKKSGFGGVMGEVAGRLGARKARDLGLDYGSSQMIGSALSEGIACLLTPEERKKANEAATRSLNSGRTGKESKSTWTSPDSTRPGVGGGTTVVSRSNTEGRHCAVTSTFVTDVDGNEKSVEREMCQQTDGRWEAA